MAMILSLFWILCCCQCCKRYPCTPYFKDTNGCQMPVKAGFSVCSGGLALAMLLCVALSPFGQLTTGVNRTVCTAAEMAHVAMSGVDGATKADGSLAGNGFPGFLPLCENIDNLLKDQLSVPTAETPPTAFVPSARAILADTETLERKLSVIVSSLDLLSQMANDASNVDVSSGHKNLVLSEVGPKLGEVQTALATTLGGMLEQVKTMTDEFLGDDNLKVLFGNVDQLLVPMKDMKATFVGQMGDMVTKTTEPGTPFSMLPQVMQIVERVALAFGSLQALFAIMSLACLALLWLKAPGSEDKKPQRFIGCTWCCGCLCTYVICIVSVILSVAAWPISSSCLVMIDLSPDTMAKYNIDQWAKTLFKGACCPSATGIFSRQYRSIKRTIRQELRQLTR